MTLNDLLTRQNVFNKLVLTDGDKELSKELKVKLMRIRMAYSKIKKNFDAEVQDFTEELMTDEFKELNNKVSRTPEEESRYKELSKIIETDYQEFIKQKGFEEVDLGIDGFLTLEEYTDVLDVNSGNDIVINNNEIKAADFMEIVYELFVKEN